MASGSDPAGDAAAVTPSDSTRLNGVRGLYVGAAGNVAVKFDRNATVVTFTAVPVGTILPISVVTVMATGTTATGIIALL